MGVQISTSRHASWTVLREKFVFFCEKFNPEKNPQTEPPDIPKTLPRTFRCGHSAVKINSTLENITPMKFLPDRAPEHGLSSFLSGLNHYWYDYWADGLSCHSSSINTHLAYVRGTCAMGRLDLAFAMTIDCHTSIIHKLILLSNWIKLFPVVSQTTLLNAIMLQNDKRLRSAGPILFPVWSRSSACCWSRHYEAHFTD